MENNLNIAKKYLEKWIRQNELEIVFDFLDKYLVKTEEINTTVTLIMATYNRTKQDRARGIIYKEDINVNFSRIIISLTNCVETLLETDLLQNWIEYSLLQEEINEKQEATPQPFNEWVGNVYIPKEIEKMNDLGRKFRVMIRRVQDELAVKEYNKAYYLCIDIRDIFSAESAQLYEYLFFSYYFKEQGADRIIKETIEASKKNQTEKISYLVHYAKRYITFAKEQEFTTSKNIEWIAKEIMNKLREKYHAISKYNYIHNGEISISEIDVDIYLSLIRKTFKEFNPNSSYLNLCIKEWFGCGYLKWLQIDNKWKVENFRSGQNTLQNIELIGKLLFNQQTEKSEKDIIAKILYPFWLRKYEKIEKIRKTEDSKIDFETSMIRCIETGLIAYQLTNDKSFLDKIYTEIKGESILEWFTLMSEMPYEIKTHKWVSLKYPNFDAHFKLICEFYQDDINRVKENLSLVIANKRKDYADTIFWTKKNGNIEDYKELVECFEDWKCYQFYNKEDNNHFEEKLQGIFLEEVFHYQNRNLLKWFYLDRMTGELKGTLRKEITVQQKGKEPIKKDLKTWVWDFIFSMKEDEDVELLQHWAHRYERDLIKRLSQE